MGKAQRSFDQKIEEYLQDFKASPSVRLAPISKGRVQVDEDTRTIRGVITSEDIDRDGEVVLTKGLDLENFQKNPVVLFMHDPFAVIGKSTFQKTRKRQGRNEMFADTVFAETTLAQEVFELSKGEFLRGISIGMNFRSMERRAPTPKEIKSRPELAEAEAIIEKAEMIEFSFVSIPANQEALTTAVNKGFIKETERHFEPFIKAVVDANPRKKPFVRVVRQRSIEVVPPRMVERISLTKGELDRMISIGIALAMGRS